MKISSISMNRTFAPVVPTLILYPNSPHCTSECLPLLEGKKGSVLPSQWSPVPGESQGHFPNFLFPDAIPGDTGSAQGDRTDSEAGTAGVGHQRALGKGPTKNTEFSRRGPGISRAGEQSRDKPMFRELQRPGFEFWLSHFLCDLAQIT